MLLFLQDRVINFLSAVNTATLAQGVGLQPLQNPRDAAILAMYVLLLCSSCKFVFFSQLLHHWA